MWYAELSKIMTRRVNIRDTGRNRRLKAPALSSFDLWTRCPQASPDSYTEHWGPVQPNKRLLSSFQPHDVNADTARPEESWDQERRRRLRSWSATKGTTATRVSMQAAERGQMPEQIAYRRTQTQGLVSQRGFRGRCGSHREWAKVSGVRCGLARVGQ